MIYTAEQIRFQPPIKAVAALAQELQARNYENDLVTWAVSTQSYTTAINTFAAPKNWETMYEPKLSSNICGMNYADVIAHYGSVCTYTASGRGWNFWRWGVMVQKFFRYDGINQSSIWRTGDISVDDFFWAQEDLKKLLLGDVSAFSGYKTGTVSRFGYQLNANWMENLFKFVRDHMRYIRYGKILYTYTRRGNQLEREINSGSISVDLDGTNAIYTKLPTVAYCHNRQNRFVISINTPSGRADYPYIYNTPLGDIDVDCMVSDISEYIVEHGGTIPEEE